MLTVVWTEDIGHSVVQKISNLQIFVICSQFFQLFPPVSYHPGLISFYISFSIYAPVCQLPNLIVMARIENSYYPIVKSMMAENIHILLIT